MIQKNAKHGTLEPTSFSVKMMLWIWETGEDKIFWCIITGFCCCSCNYSEFYLYPEHLFSHTLGHHHKVTLPLINKYWHLLIYICNIFNTFTLLPGIKFLTLVKEVFIFAESSKYLSLELGTVRVHFAIAYLTVEYNSMLHLKIV